MTLLQLLALLSASGLAFALVALSCRGAEEMGEVEDFSDGMAAWPESSLNSERGL